jgi:hypothetical protein
MAYALLNNPNASPTSEETSQATASATPSYTGSAGVGDSLGGLTVSSSSSQMSSADGTTIAANTSANLSSDVSGCVDPSKCSEQSQGITDFIAEFCISNVTAYNLFGSATASPSVMNGTNTQIYGTGSVTLQSMTSLMYYADIEASNGEDVPISWPVVLPADCYEFHVEAFANTQGAVSASGNVTATCDVTLSP